MKLTWNRDKLASYLAIKKTNSSDINFIVLASYCFLVSYLPFVMISIPDDFLMATDPWELLAFRMKAGASW